MKGQVGVELIISISIILVIFLGFFFFYTSKNSDIINEGKNLNKRNECFKISSLIGQAISVGDGTIIRTSTKYNLTINNGLIYVEDISCVYTGNVSASNLSESFRIINNNSIISFKNG